jgi:hypothetical protein
MFGRHDLQSPQIYDVRGPRRHHNHTSKIVDLIFSRSMLETPAESAKEKAKAYAAKLKSWNGPAKAADILCRTFAATSFGSSRSENPSGVAAAGLDARSRFTD